jgi:hypothetical protein
VLKWGSRRAESPQAAPAPAAPVETTVTSKVFPKFLSAVAQQPSPTLLDLGPVVGSNVTFFGDRLACKMHVEDLFADVESFNKRGDRAGLLAFLATRLSQAPDWIVVVLCWYFFDFLDKRSGLVVASKLAMLVRRGGALYGTFGTTPVELKNYSRTVVAAEDSLKPRLYPATPVPRTVLLTRDIIKMFDGLIVAESMLLKSSTRETLFRRP